MQGYGGPTCCRFTHAVHTQGHMSTEVTGVQQYRGTGVQQFGGPDRCQGSLAVHTMQLSARHVFHKGAHLTGWD